MSADTTPHDRLVELLRSPAMQRVLAQAESLRTVISRYVPDSPSWRAYNEELAAVAAVREALAAVDAPGLDWREHVGRREWRAVSPDGRLWVVMRRLGRWWWQEFRDAILDVGDFADTLDEAKAAAERAAGVRP
jgi:hypothetical protein